MSMPTTDGQPADHPSPPLWAHQSIYLTVSGRISTVTQLPLKTPNGWGVRFSVVAKSSRGIPLRPGRAFVPAYRKMSPLLILRLSSLTQGVRHVRFADSRVSHRSVGPINGGRVIFRRFTGRTGIVVDRPRRFRDESERKHQCGEQKRREDDRRPPVIPTLLLYAGAASHLNHSFSAPVTVSPVRSYLRTPPQKQWGGVRLRPSTCFLSPGVLSYHRW
jgi:hypothetical protein